MTTEKKLIISNTSCVSQAQGGCLRGTGLVSAPILSLLFLADRGDTHE
jgi:hypothetical protein